jgi:hypothetical protein
MKQAHSKINKGDLVFVPASVTLLKLGPDGYPHRIRNTDEPKHVLVLETRVQGDIVYCSLLYEGERWQAPTSELYEIISQEQ